MSGYYNSDSDDDFEYDARNNGGGLRKMLEETLAENKKLLAKLESKERATSTSDLLKEKGLDPAIAELIPADTDAKAWVEKYAHLLGVAKGTPADEPAVEPDVQASDDSDPAVQLEKQRLADEQAALADMQSAQEQGLPANLSSDLLERMEKITSEDELLKFFKSNGAVGG